MSKNAILYEFNLLYYTNKNSFVNFKINNTQINIKHKSGALKRRAKLETNSKEAKAQRVVVLLYTFLNLLWRLTCL